MDDSDDDIECIGEFITLGTTKKSFKDVTVKSEIQQDDRHSNSKIGSISSSVATMEEPDYDITSLAAVTSTTPPFKKCLHCQKCVPDLENHIKTEACFTTSNYCTNCCRIFTKTSDYQTHLDEICKNKLDKPASCQFCDFQPCSKFELATHLYKNHISNLPVPHKKCRHGDWCLGLRNHLLKKCLFCDLQLDSESDLLSHLYSEHANLDYNHPKLVEAKTFKCSLCVKTFGAVSALYIHHKIGGCGSKKCPICDLIITNNVDFMAHLQTHNALTDKAKKVFECNRCVQAFKSLNDLEEHLNSCHNFKCNVCDLRFWNKSFLDKHKRSNSCKMCSLCPRIVFKDEQSVYTHVKENHVECDHCGEILPSKERSFLENHLKSTPLTKYNLACLFCSNVTFDGINSLEQHMRFQHLQCLDCSSKIYFPSIRDYIRHKYTCANAKNPREFYCLHCYLKFESAESLDAHIQEMSCVFALKNCQLCLRIFYSAEDFDNHLDTNCLHMKCQFCDLNFTSGSALSSHVSTSHAEKLSDNNFSCGKCSGWCTLIRFHRNHGYECKICSKSIKNSVCLQLHFMLDHGKTVYKNAITCSVCKFSFLNSRHYYSHFLGSNSCKTCIAPVKY